MAIGHLFIGRVSVKNADNLYSMKTAPFASTPPALLSHCEPFSRLFDEAGTPLLFVDTDRQLAFAIDAVLRLDGLGITRHLLTMVKRAASPDTPLTDRLALRAVLAGDEERAARIWRAEFDGRPLPQNGPIEPPALVSGGH